MEERAERTTRQSPKPDISIGRIIPRWILIAVFTLTIIFFLAAGNWYLLEQEDRIRTEKYNELRAIANLKTDQIVAWRNERIEDAGYYGSDSFLRLAVSEWLQHPADKALEARIQANFQSLKRLHDYNDVILTDPEGNALIGFSDEEQTLEPEARDLVRKAVQQGQVIFGDFTLCESCQKVRLDVAAPLRDENGSIIAAILLRPNLEEYFYPLIQSWPTPSRSAETLLVRQEGDQVVFLNPLRHRADPPLSLRQPISSNQLPAARAVFGEIGIYEGIDYRGVKVVSDLRPVPGTGWFMVTKMDADEILAEVRFRGWIALVFIAMGVVITVVLSGLLVNNRQSRLYHTFFTAERERADSQEIYRTTLLSIGDAVIRTDGSGAVIGMNPVAEKLTGWSEAEANGKPLSEVFRVIDDNSNLPVFDPFEEVMRTGNVVGLAKNTCLIDRAGNERPIAESGAPVKDKNGAVIGVVLVFRDQSVEREAQQALVQSEERFRTVAEHTFDWEYWRSPEGELIYCSPSCERITGYTAEEFFEDPGLVDIIVHPDDRGLVDSHRKSWSRTAGEPGFDEAEFRLIRKDGVVRWISYSSENIFRKDGTSLGRRGTIRDETDRIEAQEALIQSHRMLQAVLDTIPVRVFWKDRNLRYIGCNRPMAKDYGFENPEEILGKTDYDIMDQKQAELYVSIDSGVLSSGQGIYQLEEPHIGMDGSEEWLRASVIPLRDENGEIFGVLGSYENITEKKRDEQAIRESEASLALAQRQARMGSWTRDLKTGKARWSAELFRLFDLEPRAEAPTFGEFIEWLHPDDRRTVIETDALVSREGEAQQSEYRSNPERGPMRYFVGTTEPLYGAADRVVGLSGTVVDITERKQAEIRLRELNETLEQRVRERTTQLEAANNELESFAYSVSHDLRAPLRAMDGFSTALISGHMDELQPDTRHYLERIQEASRRMGALINDLLNLSRIARRELVRSQVDLSEFASQIVAELRSEEPDRVVQVEIQPGMSVHADPRLLRIALENLLSNAWKFSSGREPALIEIGQVEMSDKGEVFFVRDNGAGFDMAYQDKLFTPFQRLHGLKEFPGTGIGLATVQRVIARHGGSIWVEAAVDKGATFYFSLGGRVET